MRVDVGANDEGNQVEKWHPCLGRKECLRKGQGDWGGEPADTHDGPEASADSGTHLVPGLSAGDPSHACEIDGVLDWCDLRGLVSIFQCGQGIEHLRQDCS